MTRQELDRIGLTLNCKGTGKPGPCKTKTQALAKVGQLEKQHKSHLDSSEYKTAQENEYQTRKKVQAARFYPKDHDVKAAETAHATAHKEFAPHLAKHEAVASEIRELVGKHKIKPWDKRPSN